MSERFYAHLEHALDDIKQQGLEKPERIIESPQRSLIDVKNRKQVLNLCANNYLGLADHPRVIQAAKESLDSYGYGMASVRFICGTQTLHKELEQTLSRFLGTEETILYPSCFDANGGLFETLFTAEDAIISDELNHASLIDGIRLCKAQRFRYKHADLKNLKEKLEEAKDARYRIIVTDGVFSMDGTIADLAGICELGDKYDALVMFDDCHATGFLGETGKGTHEFCDVVDRIDIVTSTLGKALGGASGGFTSGKKCVIDYLRQRSRPYLFSNTVAPPVVAGALEVFNIITESNELKETLWQNTAYFREEITKAGFDILPGIHPIVPVMLGDAKVAGFMAEKLLERGVYVIGFSYPVVPHGKARIRTQISAGHSLSDLQFAVEQFSQVKKELSI